MSWYIYLSNFSDTAKESSFHYYLLEAEDADSLEVVYDLSSLVVGSHLVGRSTSGRFRPVCLGTGDILWPQGAIPPGFNPLRRGWVYRPAPRKRECWRGPRQFWNCLMCMNSSPVTGPTLNSLVPHSYAGGAWDK